MLLIVGATFANHFGNSFHFDDAHSIETNPHITTLAQPLRFFTDASTFSALPLNQSYRPLLTLSLAWDFAWGGGLRPLAFHVTSFACFLLQLVLMFLLFERLLGRERSTAALAATALYGLHPLAAETVNYIIQRGEILSTLGVVGALLLYVRSPRPFGWHLVAMLAGCMAKPPAVMLAPLLFAYVWLYADSATPRRTRLAHAIRQSAPAFVLAAIWLFVTLRLTPAQATTGGGPIGHYLATQPWVSLHYFAMFFWPNQLSADTDWTVFTALARPEFFAGLGFLLGFAALCVACARRPGWRVEAFGLTWWWLALLPTACVPLAEVLNDHRMFFPSVGLALTVTSVADRLARVAIRRGGPAVRWLVAAGVFAVLASASFATQQRNRVWNSEATLWRDVTLKSPRNGRGLMNYGLALMAKGDYESARSYFERALVLLPNYAHAETNLGIALGELGHDREAEQHFFRAMTLSDVPVAHLFFARYLRARARDTEARKVLETGLALQADRWDLRLALLALLDDQQDDRALRELLDQTRARFPGRSELDRFERALAQRHRHVLP